MRRFGLTLIITGVLAPFVSIVIWAFSFNWRFPAVFPSQIRLRAWEFVFFGSLNTGEAFWNSLIRPHSVLFLWLRPWRFCRLRHGI